MTAAVEVVLPCLDEAEALPGVLAELPPGFTALVVDNGSTDDTVAVARGLGARVVIERRRGYGAAVHTGIVEARSELVAVLDADGSLDASVLTELASVVLDGTASAFRGLWRGSARPRDHRRATAHRAGLRLLDTHRETHRHFARLEAF